jgi:tetratricopeptide (TPR) repeat protein
MSRTDSVYRTSIVDARSAMTERGRGNVAGTEHPITNGRLAALIAEAGMSHAAFARQVNHLGGQPGFGSLDLRYDSSSVHRWLRGAAPTAPTPALIAAVLARKLRRPVNAEQLLAVGEDFLEFPASAVAAADSAIALWRQIVHRRDVLRYSFVAAAGLDAGWRWAFAPAAVQVTGGGVHSVGMADVERLLAARRDFADLDRRHGGGHARAWLTDYLDREVAPLLHGSYRDEVGRALFAAAAILTETAGYMAFDDGEHGLSQRFSIQSLALAKHAGDTAFGSYVMSNMAAQLVHLGDGPKAAQMARAASASTRRAPASLLARLHTTEARGHALAGDVSECRAALRRADKALHKAEPSTAPGWLGASSPAHHAGSAMHCLYDLGQYAEAARHSREALELPPDNIRARALHQILLARVQIGLGQIELSCETATTALQATTRLRSRRLRDRIREYDAGLAPYNATAPVKAWKEEVKALLAAA